MDEYGTSDGYGGLAGFGGPALEAANAPVVRYQDLHRSHAPASAGAPAVGYGDVMSTPETGVYGDVAIASGPLVEQVPGYGMTSTRPLYGGGYGAGEYGRSSGSLEKNDTAVGDAQRALYFLNLISVDDLTNKYDTATKNAVRVFKKNNSLPDDTSLDQKTFDKLMAEAKKRRSDFGPAYTPEPSSQREREEAEEEESDSWWKRTASSVGKAAGGFTKGVARGTAKGAGVSIFEESGRDTKPVSDVKKDEERPAWQTYAIWGGATVAGVGIAYLLYRSFSKSEKKGGA